MSLTRPKLRGTWRRLGDGEPGRRFQDRYHQGQQAGRGTLRRWLYVGGGLIVIVAGLFLLPAPGPGFLVLFAGGGLVAQESLLAARALDWIEVRLRRGAGVGKRFWRRSSAAVRTLVVVLALVVAGSAAFGGYQLLFAR